MQQYLTRLFVEVMEVDGVHVDMDEMTILCDKLKVQLVCHDNLQDC